MKQDLNRRYKEVWIRIGEYGTPAPFIVSDTDQLIAKECFNNYLSFLKSNGINCNPEDKVEVISQESDGLFLSRKHLFEGTVSKAETWAKNKDSR